ncbi:MAG: DedA family protein [DPANN group archaeon]|nr:DedA family protein [DPANN group archaeon]
MVLQLASTLTAWIAEAGYMGLFFLIAGESSLLPLPSEVILPFAGFLVFSGKMMFWPVVLVAILGQIFGSAISYAIGYYGGRPLVLRYGKYFLLSPKHFEQVESWFCKHCMLAVFFSRLLPVVRTIISFPAGITKVNFKKFLLFSALGITPWTVFLVYVGFRLGAAWQSIITTFDKFQLVVIAGLIAFLIWWVWNARRENHKSFNT